MSLERINLNVPPEARRQLKAVARRLHKTESEVARELLLDALRREEKQRFYERVADQMTPELRRRLVDLAEALDDIDG